MVMVMLMFILIGPSCDTEKLPYTSVLLHDCPACPSYHPHITEHIYIFTIQNCIYYVNASLQERVIAHSTVIFSLRRTCALFQADH